MEARSLMIRSTPVDRYRQLVHGQEPTDLPSLFRATVAALGTLKLEYPQRNIYLVSGRVSSNETGGLERNEARLRAIAAEYQAKHPNDIFVSSAQIMPEIRETIRRSNPKYEDFKKLWVEVIKYDIHGGRYLSGVVMTPGWQLSEGATDEHNTALQCGLDVSYYHGEPFTAASVPTGRRDQFLG